MVNWLSNLLFKFFVFCVDFLQISTMSDIFTAVFTGDLKLIKEMATKFNNKFGEQKAKEILGAKDSKGRTILHIAASEGYTPLHHAVVEGHFMTSSFLLDHGADPNVTSNAGLTPLHYAAKIGKKDLVKLLITKGAEVDAPSSSAKGTPLRFATAYSMKEAVKILLEHKANPNYATHPVLNPLMVAVLEKSVDCVRLLLKHGADPNLGFHGERPLIAAVQEGLIEIMKCLLKAGANPNATNFCDLTPIEIAAVEGNLEIVNILFDFTAPIPHIPTWSIPGIHEYINSREVKNQRELKAETRFLEANENAAQSVRENDYMTAVYWYTEAVRIKPTDGIMFSNRSFCFIRLNQGNLALSDAKICIRLRQNWAKGYYRAGAAYMMLQDYQNAVAAFGYACTYEPLNTELRDAYIEALAELKAPRNR
ncbi:uncharacterized protein [Spinacia oleracea]|uniref:Uncharacterized protein isoform X2 n=1 Tax=Spinacia oleracea TaxID=3562 RepID=A0ABM3QME8_SPIOL|nr:uncharacterized protein LOC110781862 isoform X2 [Spinacia oleracea]